MICSVGRILFDLQPNYPSYTEIVGYKMLGELMKVARSRGLDESMVVDEDGNLPMAELMKEAMEQLAQKYDDPDAADRIQRALDKVEYIKMEMASNISTMLAQLENLKTLEDDAKAATEESKVGS